MTKYRRQQLAAAALIDSGDYTAEQVAEVYGWIKPKPPERTAPAGHNRALTPRRKCDIIKAIKRHVRRWKRKQEEKKMKKIQVFWENAECALKPGTPCIFAWADLPNGEQIGAEFELSDDDFDSPEDCEPSEDADRRAAVYLRDEITKQAKAAGFAADMLDFQF